MKILFKNSDILFGDNFDLLKNSYLSVNGETIEYIGKDKPEGDFDRVIDMKNKLLIPGLVNAHCHVPMTLLRGYGEELPLDRWLNEKIFPIEAKMTGEDIAAGSEIGIAEMIASGVTSFSDMYFMGEYTAQEVIKSGIKCNLTRAIWSFDENERLSNLKCFEEFKLLQKEYHKAANERVLVDYCIHAEYTCFPSVIEEYSAIAAAEKGIIHIHLSETKSEHENCIKKYGKTPAKLFYDCGTFDAKCMVAHCVYITDEDLQLLKEKGVTIVHNPTSNLKLGSGVAPLKKFLEAGVNVALGTDGASSNNNLNMFEEMHLASLIHKGVMCDPTVIKAHEVLKMATRNGALAQGRDNTGILKEGFRADIAAIDMDKPHFYPNLNPLMSLMYSAQASDVYLTMADGVILYEKGDFKTIDIEKAKFRLSKRLELLYNKV